MYTATRDLVLPTTITGSLPRPHWHTENLHGRPFRVAMADMHFREQYRDAVSCLRPHARTDREARDGESERGGPGRVDCSGEER